MADSDQAIRDIVAQLNGYPTDAQSAASAAPVVVMPAPEVTPAMSYATPQSAPASAPVAAPAQTINVGGYAMPQMGDPSRYQPAQAAPSTVPGPGGYSAADRFNKFSLPAGGGPLSVADAQKVIDSYESTGGHAFVPATPSGGMGAIAAPSIVPAQQQMGAMFAPAAPTGGNMAALVAPAAPAPTSPGFTAAQQKLNLSPQEQALYQRHLTNLNGPGGVDNPDGSRSTLYQSVEPHNGRYYNIPTVWDGKREVQPYTRQNGTVMDVANPTALANVAKAGWDTFPSYATPDEADARYNQMHGYMDQDTSAYMKQRGR